MSNLKKSLMVLALTMVSSAGFAQTQLELKPTEPADCKLRDYQYVNTINTPQKVSEDADYAVWSFITYHSSCTDGVYTTLKVDPQYLALKFYKTKLFSEPMKKSTQIDLKIIAENVVQVRLTINKKRLFANKSSIKSDMIFVPNYVEVKPQFILNPFAPQPLPRFEPIMYWWNAFFTFDQNAPVDSQTKVHVSHKNLSKE